MALSLRWLCFWLVSLFAVGNVSAQILASGEFVAAGGMTITYEVTKNPSSPGFFYFKTTNTAFGSFGSVEVGYIGYSNSNMATSGTSRTVSLNSGSSSTARMAYVQGRRTNTSGNSTRVEFQLPAWDATDNPQTVTVSPTTVNPLKVGQPATFTASGGNTSYSWTATGNPEISGSGNSRTVTWPEEGVWTVSVYAVSGPGYYQSNTATASAFVAKEITVRIPVKNGNPVGSGVLVAGIGKKNGVANNNWTTAVLQPQQTDTVVIDGVKTGDVVTVDIVRVGVKKDADGNLIPGNSDFNLGPVDYVLIETDTIDHSTTYSGDLETPENASTVNVVKGEIQDSDKSVWTPSDPASIATDGTMKQGFDKTIGALEGINETLKQINAKTGTGGTGGGGTGSGEFSDVGTHERLDTANSHLEKLGLQADETKDLKDGTPSTSDMTNAGNAAGQSESNAVEQFTSPAVAAAGSMPVFGITMPSAFGGKTFNLNPFQSDRFASICAWHRRACEWLAIILFGLWCSKEASAMIRGLNQANQAKGNAVLAGTGGQATALIAAGLITVVIAVAIVAVCTFASTSLGGGTLLSAVSDDPFSGLVGGAVWMMDQLFPLGAVIACFAGRLVWQAAAQSAYTTAAAAIRFIVP